MIQVRHLIDPTDFSVEELDSLFLLTEQIIANPKKYASECKGKILATLFYEPSTRTRFSFEAAMMRLGGSTLGFSDPSSSSVTKGENIPDTIRIVGGYADIAVMRHPMEGSPKAASLYSKIPVINAGDGGHQHPTQTLTDLFTIKTIKGRLNSLKIGVCGDLKYGRTTHSLVKAMARYEGVELVLISPEELRMPAYIIKELSETAGIIFSEVYTLEEAISDLDVLYMTRVQKERFPNEEDYLKVKDSCILDMEKMALAKDDMIVLHPLPRVNEITPEVDQDPRACYFKQAEFGMYVRMALIMKLLEDSESIDNIIYVNNPLTTPLEFKKCANPKCITSYETMLKQRFVNTADGIYRCDYCGAVLEE